MHEIKIGSRKEKVPSCWEEVSEKDLSKIILHLIAETKHKEVRVLCYLLKIKKSELKRLTDVQVVLLLETIDFLFKAFPESPTIESFTIRGKEFVSPGKRLETSSILEYAFADLYYNQFVKTQSIESLNKLIAVLYRPISKEDGVDKREDFDSFKTEAYSKEVDVLSIGKKLSILLFFVGCKKAIASSYKAAYSIDYSRDESIPEEIRSQFQEVDKKESNPFGYFTLINTLSKTAQYGDYEKVCKTNLHIIFTNLVIDIQTAKNTPAPKQ